MSLSDLCVAPARAEDAADARAFCDALFASVPAAQAWWRSRLAQGPERLLIVRGAGDRVVALATIEGRPTLRLDGRMTMTARGPEAPAELDAALLPAFDAMARRLGFGLLAASVFGPTPEAELPCPAGFAPWQRLLVVSLPLDQPATAPPEGVRLAPHAGGDPAAEAEAAAIAWRMLRRERIWPPLDGPGLAALMAAPESLWLLARDTATGRVVGVAETFPETGLFSMLAVSRSHWGTGLADHMTREGLRAMAARGAASAFSLVRPENAASLKLQARSGASVGSAALTCVREIAPDP